MEKAGQRAVLAAGDLANPAYCQQVIDLAVKGFERIDVLVNNAAYQMTHETLEEIDEAEHIRYQRRRHVPSVQGGPPSHEGRRINHQHQFHQL